MRAWADCEFCSFQDPAPISVGLVDERGRVLHGVFEFDETRCSPFVVERVLPQLPQWRWPRMAFAARLKKWLVKGGISEIVCDTNYDVRILRDLGVETPIRLVKQLPKEEREKLFKHHALEDAKVLAKLYP